MLRWEFETNVLDSQSIYGPEQLGLAKIPRQNCSGSAGICAVMRQQFGLICILSFLRLALIHHAAPADT
jgi:hypothetical protein